MSQFFQSLSLLFIPGIFTLILLYGLWKKAPVYDAFTRGARDGLKTAAELLPFLVAIFIGIEALVSSGAMERLEELAEPVLRFLGIPEELTALVLLRPVSGSGSLALVERILVQCGADSFAGRAAAVMAGTAETVFYVLAVYFGVTAVRRTRHALAAGLAGYAAAVLASVVICRYL
ncbi:MAG: nucleoside recognition domain-containing protein [Bacillota bacterium]|nr:nucleoside recognition domain-containing protein [Bacillota bacterium]